MRSKNSQMPQEDSIIIPRASDTLRCIASAVCPTNDIYIIYDALYMVYIFPDYCRAIFIAHIILLLVGYLASKRMYRYNWMLSFAQLTNSIIISIQQKITIKSRLERFWSFGPVSLSWKFLFLVHRTIYRSDSFNQNLVSRLKDPSFNPRKTISSCPKPIDLTDAIALQHWEASKHLICKFVSFQTTSIGVMPALTEHQ